MFKIASYKFGSHITGLSTQFSDIDKGEVFAESLLDLLGSTFVPNFQRMRDIHDQESFPDIDYEFMHLNSFVKQCFDPSPNFHAKLHTLYSPYDYIYTFRHYAAKYINWKSYLFKCIAFCNNCEKTVKGIGHQVYVLSLANHQYWQEDYAVNPQFWKSDSNSLVSRYVKFRNSGMNYEQILDELYDDYIVRLVNLEEVAKEFPKQDLGIGRQKSENFAEVYYQLLKEIMG